MNGFQFVADYQRRYGVKRLCTILGIDRSNSYYWRRTAVDTDLDIDALAAAARTRCRLAGTVMHTDHGAQYASSAFAAACRSVVVTAAFGNTGHHRQHGLGPVQGMDLRLLVHTQDQGLLRRVEVEAHHVTDLGCGSPRHAPPSQPGSVPHRDVRVNPTPSRGRRPPQPSSPGLRP